MKKTNMRAGFTMIELIFVIVIIGILAAIAMNKLSATRDDAKVAKAVTNLKTCISDIGSTFTATQKESTSPTSDPDGSKAFDSCKAVKDDNCFVIGGVENNTSADGNITTKWVDNGEKWCPLAAASAAKKGLVKATQKTVKTISFGGSHIVE